MESFPHSLIVECSRELTSSQKRQLERYFALRRKSQGGPCQVSIVSTRQFRVSYVEERVMHRVMNQNNHQIECDGEVITLLLQIDEQIGQENFAVPILQDSEHDEIETAECHGDSGTSTPSHVNAQTAMPLSENPQSPGSMGVPQQLDAAGFINRETSSSITIDSPAQFFVIGNDVLEVVNSFRGVHFRLGHREVELFGNPADLQQLRELIRKGLKLVKIRHVKVSENKRQFLNSWDKKDISEKLFGSSAKGCVILDASQGLRLYSTSLDLLDQAEKDLQGLIVEEVIEVQANECPEDWEHVLENIKHNKNIFHSYKEIKHGHHWILSLSGFTREVDVVMKVLKDLLSKRKIVQEDFQLGNPDLVQNLNDLLKSFKLGPLKATVQPSHVPGHVLSLRGTQNEIDSSKRVLENFKKNFFHQHLCIPKHGATRFFKNKSKELFPKMLAQYNCCIHIKRESVMKNPSSEEDIKSKEIPSGSRKMTVQSDKNEINETDNARPKASTTKARPPVQLVLSYGNLEEQKADVIAAPLLASNPTLPYLNVTRALQSKAATTFSQLFSALLNGRMQLTAGIPLDMDVSGGNYNLQCNTVVLIPCNQWNGPDHLPVKALRQGIAACLEICKNKNVSSLAMSTIGAGIALKVPNEEAAKILGEEVKSFVERKPNTCLQRVQVVIQAGNKVLFAAYKDTLTGMDLGNKIVLCNEDGAPFLVPSFGNQIQVKVGNLSLFVEYGDITLTNADALVNSTNFKQWKEKSVACAIFTKAGPEVIKKAIENNSSVNKPVMTGPGALNCKYIFHLNCQGKVESIIPLTKEVILKCDEIGLRSVALPAIGTGECNMDPQVVAKHMIKAIVSLTQNKQFNYLACVRLVAFRPSIYSIFCSELEPFKSSWNPMDTLTSRLKCLKVPNTKTVEDINIFEHPLPRPPPTLLSIVGKKKEDVEKVKYLIKQAFEKDYMEKEIKLPWLHILSLEEIMELFSVIKNKLDVQIILEVRQNSIHLNGCQQNVKDALAQVQDTLTAILDARKECAKRERAGLLVQWAYGNGPDMELFSEDASVVLEDMFLSKSQHPVIVVIKDMKKAKVNLQTMQASLEGIRHDVAVQRWDLESEIGLPMQWDEMKGLFLLLVPLDPNSDEYREVQTNFSRTAANVQVVKIQRIQNKYQYIAYMMKKADMKKKNGAPMVNERTLYYDTNHENYPSINFKGFNRNATDYGEGLSFAVNAECSAKSAGFPQDSQLQLVYQVKVLAGRYTKGVANMQAPPPRTVGDSFGQYDSVVDNDVNPTIFVVFHDCQVYPEYLITIIS